MQIVKFFLDLYPVGCSVHKTCVVLYEKEANLCCGVIDVSMHTWTACVCFCVLSYLCVRCCMHIIFICFRLVAMDFFSF